MPAKGIDRKYQVCLQTVVGLDFSEVLGPNRFTKCCQALATPKLISINFHYVLYSRKLDWPLIPFQIYFCNLNSTKLTDHMERKSTELGINYEKKEEVSG